MPRELEALIDKPVLLIAILFVGALIGLQVERFSNQQKRAEWRKRNVHRFRGPWGDKVSVLRPMHAPEVAKMQSAADQLRTVMQADFRARPLLNKSEARAYARDCPRQSLR